MEEEIEDVFYDEKEVSYSFEFDQQQTKGKMIRTSLSSNFIKTKHIAKLIHYVSNDTKMVVNMVLTNHN